MDKFPLKDFIIGFILAYCIDQTEHPTLLNEDGTIYLDTSEPIPIYE